MDMPRRLGVEFFGTFWLTRLGKSDDRVQGRTRASHAKGFHLHVLLKPCVNLSIHTASDVRPPTFTNRQ